jgi:protein-S-isoprenylcysteine O-methyltransferase Ste14
MSSRVREMLFQGVAITAVFLIVLPLLLFILAPPFAGKAAGFALFLLAGGERLWAMYLRRSTAAAGHDGGRDWTAIAVGYAYVLTLGGAVTEFLLRRRGFPGWPVTVGGGLAYAGGVTLRYWALGVLNRQWHVDVTNVAGERHLVREGPYRHLRHPLYLGACLEAAGLPAILGAWGALLGGVLVFIPLELARACFEERFLRALFGDAYTRYAQEVRAFLPLRIRPGKAPGGNRPAAG